MEQIGDTTGPVKATALLYSRQEIGTSERRASYPECSRTFPLRQAILSVAMYIVLMSFDRLYDKGSLSQPELPPSLSAVLDHEAYAGPEIPQSWW